jgi:4'-phosphopantetheinyl transferase
MPTPIYWMLVNADQLPPDPRKVLSISEQAHFAGFRFPKRRDEWLLGRWAAKSLAASLPVCQSIPIDRIQIANTAEGAPYYQVVDGLTPADCLTISHSDRLAFCALCSAPGLHIGADLEKIDPRSGTFVQDYFTPTERELVNGCPVESRPLLVTLIWSAKEAMLKALGVGLRLDTRMVEVCGFESSLPAQTGWQAIRVVDNRAPGHAWIAWWQHRRPFILTLAAFAEPPADLQSIHLVEQRLSK